MRRNWGGKPNSRPLLHLHSLPADKPIDIIDQKHRKAYDDCDVPFVAETRQCP